MFGGETNVCVGQLNQSSIEILFAVCHGRVSVALSYSKPSVVCSESSFLPKNRPKLQEHHHVFNEPVPHL
jgi:hypothetical protein